ncbi:MAG: trehalose-6-phosphate synthase [Alphaproteobacteria bacterium]
MIVSNRVAMPRGQTAQAGGVAIALREALQRHGGLWFGWSGEVADDARFEPRVVKSGAISYATVDLTPKDHADYYIGYANGTLWPLFHYRLGRAEFRPETYEGYRRVNRAMAQALKPLLRSDDDVWVHDYHFLFLAEELRRIGVGNRIGQFLHTPFPPPEILTMAPHHADLVRGLFASDLLGLQTPADVRSFRRYITDELGGVMGPGGNCVAFERRVKVAAHPVGIDTASFVAMAKKSRGGPEVVRLRGSLGERSLILGVDRLDYSKGLFEKIAAFGALLESHPEHRAKITFMQIAPVSRGEVAQYRALRREIDAAAGRVNGKFGEVGWVPVHYLNRSLPRTTLAGLYRMARVGFVTPLRDGMNLVAKEYVAAQDPADPGVLVLSRFAGASRELTGAIIVNPHDIDAVGNALHDALSMPIVDRRERWRAMLARLEANTVDVWRERYLDDLSALPRADERDLAAAC